MHKLRALPLLIRKAKGNWSNFKRMASSYYKGEECNFFKNSWRAGRKRQCPMCGAVNSHSNYVCWLCDEGLAVINNESVNLKTLYKYGKATLTWGQVEKSKQELNKNAADYLQPFVWDGGKKKAVVNPHYQKIYGDPIKAGWAIPD